MSRKKNQNRDPGHCRMTAAQTKSSRKPQSRKTTSNKILLPLNSKRSFILKSVENFKMSAAKFVIPLHEFCVDLSDMSRLYKA